MCRRSAASVILRRHHSRSISSLLCVRKRSAICEAVAEQRLADEIATFIFDRNDGTALGVDIDEIALINPQMTLPDAIRATLVNSELCFIASYSATKSASNKVREIASVC